MNYFNSAGTVEAIVIVLVLHVDFASFNLSSSIAQMKELRLGNVHHQGDCGCQDSFDDPWLKLLLCLDVSCHGDKCLLTWR